MDHPAFTAYAHLAVEKPISDDQKQEFFLELLRHPEATEAQARELLAITINRYRYQDRKHGHPAPYDHELAITAAPDQGGACCTALDLLPAEEQQLITAHVIQGHSLRELARQHGVSKDTMRKRYNHAKRKLQEKVANSTIPNAYL